MELRETPAGCAPDCWAAALRSLAGSCLVELARAFQKKIKKGGDVNGRQASQV